MGLEQMGPRLAFRSGLPELFEGADYEQACSIVGNEVFAASETAGGAEAAAG